MHFLGLSTLITLAISAIAVSALPSPTDAPTSKLELIKRGKPCEAGYYRPGGQGICQPIPGDYPQCVQWCVAGRDIGAGVKSTCDQQNHAKFPSVGTTNAINLSQDQKSKTFRVFSSETDIKTLRFDGTINDGDTLTLGSNSPYMLSNGDKAAMMGRNYYVEYQVGSWTYYYKVSGLKSCQTVGPQATNLFSELSSVTVLKECWTNARTATGACPNP